MELTREKAKELFSKCQSDFIIDKIYDSFENRTCENCKYIDDEYFDLFCINPNVINQHDHLFGDGQSMYDNFKVSANFGCNKWESK